MECAVKAGPVDVDWAASAACRVRKKPNLTSKSAYFFRGIVFLFLFDDTRRPGIIISEVFHLFQINFHIDGRFSFNRMVAECTTSAQTDSKKTEYHRRKPILDHLLSPLRNEHVTAPVQVNDPSGGEDIPKSRVLALKE
jgi:hypothetical protein